MLSDSYHDFANDLQEELDHYLNNKDFGYGQEDRERAGTLLQLIRAEGSFIDMELAPEKLRMNGKTGVDAIKEYNSLLDSLKKPLDIKKDVDENVERDSNQGMQID